MNLIARGLSSVSWLLYDGEHELEEHPLLALLQNPNPRQSGSAFMEAVIGYFLLSGNSYVEAIVNSAGTPVELYPLRPDRLSIVAGNHGVPAAYEYSVNGQKRQVVCDPITGKATILHLKSFHPQNDWYGFSAIEAAAQSIDQHNVVAGHNLALLQNGGRPSGALCVQGKGLTAEQRETLREDMRRLYEGGENAGRLMVLEGDFQWQEMGLSPKDLDFIEGKNVSAREIAQAFGVPPMLVGVPGDATFANYKEARYHLWEDTIISLLDFMISELNRWLVPYFEEGGKKLRLAYDPDSIPALTPRREALWEKVSKTPFLTINEKRNAVGYSPLTEGDMLK